MLTLVESFQKQMDAVNAKHDEELRRTVEGAERAVDEAVRGLMMPREPDLDDGPLPTVAGD